MRTPGMCNSGEFRVDKVQMRGLRAWPFIRVTLPIKVLNVCDALVNERVWTIVRFDMTRYRDHADCASVIIIPDYLPVPGSSAFADAFTHRF